MRQSNTFMIDEGPFRKGAKSIANNLHEVILLMKFLQTKPQVEAMKIGYMLLSFLL